MKSYEAWSKACLPVLSQTWSLRASAKTAYLYQVYYWAILSPCPVVGNIFHDNLEPHNLLHYRGKWMYQ